MRMVSVAAMAAMLCGAPTASAQVAPHNAAKFAEVFAEAEAIFGGRAAFQQAFEDSRAEQARMEGALQLSINLEERFRLNGASDSADIYLKAANALRPSVENLRVTFAKFDALDTPLDEARAQAAYDRIAQEHAAVFKLPMTEQYEYSQAHGLTPEPLKSMQMIADVLIAIATKAPG